MIVHKANFLLRLAVPGKRTIHRQFNFQATAQALFTVTRDIESLGLATVGKVGHSQLKTLLIGFTTKVGRSPSVHLGSVDLETKHVEPEDTIVTFIALAHNCVAHLVVWIDRVGETFGIFRGPGDFCVAVEMDYIALKVALKLMFSC